MRDHEDWWTPEEAENGYAPSDAVWVPEQGVYRLPIADPPPAFRRDGRSGDEPCPFCAGTGITPVSYRVGDLTCRACQGTGVYVPEGA